MDINSFVIGYQRGKASGGECVTMVVNVTRTNNGTFEGVYSSDKSISEILEAYDNGKRIVFDLLHSGYHWIFTDGVIALTNRTPYQGLIEYSNDIMYFTADNATTENNVDSFKSSMKEPTGGSVVAVEASQLEDLDFAKYPVGTLIVGYEDLNEEDIKGVTEQ